MLLKHRNMECRVLLLANAMTSIGECDDVAPRLPFTRPCLRPRGRDTRGPALSHSQPDRCTNARSDPPSSGAWQTSIAGGEQMLRTQSVSHYFGCFRRFTKPPAGTAYLLDCVHHGPSSWNWHPARSGFPVHSQLLNTKSPPCTWEWKATPLTKRKMDPRKASANLAGDCVDGRNRPRPRNRGVGT